MGFKVNTDIEEKNDSEIAEGNVIGTKPQTDRSVKKGTSITLIVSIGSKGIVLENYVGKNYFEIKAMLEEKNIYVLTDKKEVDEKDTAKENIIIEQKPAVGTKVVEGDTVTLVIPDIITEYPDFVNESWSVNDIQAFCDEYNINLSIEYKETSDYSEGTIISQSRAAESRVMSNTSLKIVVATAPIDDTSIDDIIPTD